MSVGVSILFWHGNTTPGGILSFSIFFQHEKRDWLKAEDGQMMKIHCLETNQCPQRRRQQYQRSVEVVSWGLLGRFLAPKWSVLKKLTLNILNGFDNWGSYRQPPLRSILNLTWAGENKKPKTMKTVWRGNQAILKLSGRVNQASLKLCTGYSNTVCWLFKYCLMDFINML